MRKENRRRPWKVIWSVLGLVVLGYFGIFPIFMAPPEARWLVFVAATLPAAFYTFLVILLDKNEIEPTRALLGTFLWGALVATLIAGIINSIGGAFLGRYLSAAVVAPLSEETAKGAALLFLYFRRRREFDNVLDGIVYGSLVGIGFAMVENYQYFADAAESGPAQFQASFYVRVVVDGWAHAAYTATFGAALGYARETSSTWRRRVAPFIGWFCAVLQHAAWNGIGTIVLVLAIRGAGGEGFSSGQVYTVAPIVNLFFLGPGFVTLLVLARMAWKREARVIAEQLAPERDAGLLTADEYARLCSPARRRREEWRVLRAHGRHAWNALLNFDQAATDLAFRKWHVSRGEAPKRHQAELSEDDLRREIAGLRARVHARTGGGLAPSPA